jgi:hypothetical protein
MLPRDEAGPVGAGEEVGAEEEAAATAPPFFDDIYDMRKVQSCATTDQPKLLKAYFLPFLCDRVAPVGGDDDEALAASAPAHSDPSSDLYFLTLSNSCLCAIFLFPITLHQELYRGWPPLELLL